MVVKAMALESGTVSVNPPSTAVELLQLFDNVAYHSFTTKDTIILCRKDQKLHCHMDRASSCWRC